MSRLVLFTVRRGRYADSVILMELQSRLAARPGVADAGAVMATATNLDVLRESGLLPPDLPPTRADDLVVVVAAEGREAAESALAAVDELLERRAASSSAGPYRHRSLQSALAALPDAEWVLVSVPGAHAAGVAREALAHDRHVFLFSDNVPVEDERELKAEAVRRGRFVMGPDCGTAIVGGVGFGFANRVRSGPVGIVAASGTGLQAVASRIHARQSGVSTAIGTGGRDLAAAVGGPTALQALHFLGRDPATEVVVLVSKPPAPEVATRLLAAARALRKPVVVHFLGAPLPGRRLGPLTFAAGLEEAADLAVELVGAPRETGPTVEPVAGSLLGLFAGGTLAHAVAAALQAVLGPFANNLGLPRSSGDEGHRLLDLGADEYTTGRPHPMLDGTERNRRVTAAGATAGVGLLLLDVVLGHGADPDPAGGLAAAIGTARARAASAGRRLDALVLLVGTDEDPQGLEGQREALEAAGAEVVASVDELVSLALDRFATSSLPSDTPSIRTPIAAVNVGLEGLFQSLVDQGASAVQVDWRPPAGGDRRLGSILERMKRR